MGCKHEISEAFHMFLMWLKTTTLNPKELFHKRWYSLVRKTSGLEMNIEILILPLIAV